MVDYDQFVSYSGIVKVTEYSEATSNFFINPNPVNGASNLVFSKPETGMLQVFNSSGNVVVQQKFNNQLKVPLKTGTLSPGNYHVIFISNTGQRQVKRFVKL